MKIIIGEPADLKLTIDDAIYIPDEGSYEIRLPIKFVEVLYLGNYIDPKNVILNDVEYRIYYQHKIRFNSKIYNKDDTHYTLRIKQ